MGDSSLRCPLQWFYHKYNTNADKWTGLMAANRAEPPHGEARILWDMFGKCLLAVHTMRTYDGQNKAHGSSTEGPRRSAWQTVAG